MIPNGLPPDAIEIKVPRISGSETSAKKIEKEDKLIALVIPLKNRDVYSHTRALVKIKHTQEILIKKSISRIVFLLPISSIKINPKIAPTNDPSVVEDTSQDASLGVSRINELLRVSRARFGEVHPICIPNCIINRNTKTQRNLINTISMTQFHSRSRNVNLVSRMLKF
jgi:hypothetical protein